MIKSTMKKNVNNILAKKWRNFNWKKAEKKILKLQQEISKHMLNKEYRKIKRLQEEIVNSIEAKALAVKKITEQLGSTPGIDNIKWKTNTQKMQAVLSITSKNYVCKPLKQIIIKDEKRNKERKIGIPCMKDRAMQIIYSYALSPIAEVTADEKSFAFRKGRSSADAHYTIMNILSRKKIT